MAYSWNDPWEFSRFHERKKLPPQNKNKNPPRTRISNRTHKLQRTDTKGSIFWATRLLSFFLFFLRQFSVTSMIRYTVQQKHTLLVKNTNIYTKLIYINVYKRNRNWKTERKQLSMHLENITRWPMIKNWIINSH